MYRLKRLNVIKEVGSKHKADKLISEGFTLTSQPTFGGNVVKASKPSKEAEFNCPHCDKTYTSEKRLANHIKKEHSEE